MHLSNVTLFIVVRSCFFYGLIIDPLGESWNGCLCVCTAVIVVLDSTSSEIHLDCSSLVARIMVCCCLDCLLDTWESKSGHISCFPIIDRSKGGRLVGRLDCTWGEDNAHNHNLRRNCLSFYSKKQQIKRTWFLFFAFLWVLFFSPLPPGPHALLVHTI